MIVVTGAAGFIGSCVVSKLNQVGHEDLLLVDHYDNPQDAKKKNLEQKKYIRFIEKEDFIGQVAANQIKENIKTVIHMGACSSTTLQDREYFQKNNVDYTKKLAQWCLAHQVRFIYASSAATYGDGSHGYSDDDATVRRCEPLNMYGQSKQIFDDFALGNGWLAKMVGLKFFNVFGPNEYHKGDMRSIVAKAYEKVAKEGKMSLFKSYKKEYKDGQQKRDFIYVKDAVDIVMFFFDHPQINGLFNVGTGEARTWNDLANALFAAVGKKPVIEYIDMPEILKDKYQYFTQADMLKLRSAGYKKPFTRLEDAVSDYAGYLKKHSYY